MTLGNRLQRVFPWGVEAGVRSLVLTAGCGVGLIVVWWGTADRGVFSTQVGWLTAGIAVLMVSLYGHVSLVVRARRAIGEYRAALIDDSVLDLLPLLAGVATPDTASRHVVRELGVVVKGFDLYHEQGCAMTAGREIVIVSRSEAADSGLVSCGICCRNSTGAPVGGPQ